MKKVIFLKVLVIMVMFTLTASAKKNDVFSPYQNQPPVGSNLASSNYLGVAWCGTTGDILTIHVDANRSFTYGVNGNTANVFTENMLPGISDYGVTISSGFEIEYIGASGSGTLYPPAGFYYYQ
ncbi:MAG: hypothetical protein V4663_10470 [Bacteroidota bacterium]